MGRDALIKVLSVFLLVLTGAALLTSSRAKVAQAAPSIVSLSPSTSTVNCGSGASIIATVTDPAGLASGSVSFTASLGTITPYAAVTGGSAVAQYTAPATAGTAVITASINGSTQQTSVTVTCNANCPYGTTVAGCNTTSCTAPTYQYGTPQYTYQNQGCNSCGGYTTLPCAGCTSYTPCSPAIQCSGANCGTSCTGGNCTQVCTSVTCGAACSYNTANSCSGPPAKVTVSSGGSLSCDSVAGVSVSVVDAGGLPVPDGTTVTGTTTLGRISGPVVTKNGAATLTLILGTKDAGTASLTVTSGGATGPGSFSVTCSAPSTASLPQTSTAPALPPQQTVQQPPTTISAPPPPPTGVASGTPNLRPPNTGDAGLLALRDNPERTPA